ncbi:aminotransferase class I/II-fold pyridoxal phosphate-dependent enzyme [Roseiconus nitratireducens]|nr:8-amino-7-oxononanoate synthase [Roseiconus nitratireducens]
MWDDLSESLSDLRRCGRLRKLTPTDSRGVRLVLEDGSELVNFGSNDYLGLAAVVGESSPDRMSAGATASALVCGWTRRHQCLADRIAALEETEAAVVFPSGYAACSGTIAALGRSGDLILSDQLNHASLIDGCRLSRADCIVYPHRDMNSLAEVLARCRGQYGRAWIVTNTVFSMDGHLAPLAELADIGDQFDANLIVDEAHATGVLGDRGSGACEWLGVKDRVAVRIGTLSKALGSQGGFVAGPGVVIDYLLNHCRPLIYSTSLALPAVESAIEAFDRIEREPERRQRVRTLAERVRMSLGLECDPVEAVVPILPIPVGQDGRAVELSARLRRSGLYVPAIRPPTVPDGQARLRVSLSASHSDEMVQRLIAGLATL